LLGFRVPLRGDQEQGGSDGGFEDAEENAGDEECAVGGRRAGAGGGNTPEDDVEGEPFCWGEGLEEIYYIVVSKFSWERRRRWWVLRERGIV
jgi:hypothetical protein